MMLTRNNISRAISPADVKADGAALFLWCLLIFLLSSVPGNQYPSVSWEYSDKLVHFGLYLPLGFLAMRLLAGHLNRGWAAALLFSLVYAATDEWHQFFVPSRSCELADWLADSVGAGIGIMLFSMIAWRMSASGAGRGGQTINSGLNAAKGR